MNVREKVLWALLVILLVITAVQEHQLYVLRDKVLEQEECIVQLQKHVVHSQIKDLGESVKELERTLKEKGYVQ